MQGSQSQLSEPQFAHQAGRNIMASQPDFDSINSHKSDKQPEINIECDFPPRDQFSEPESLMVYPKI